MRIVLVDNLLVPRGDLLNIDTQPHLGLISLTSILRSANHEVTLIDPKFLIKSGELVWNQELYRSVAKRIGDWKPDVLGFTTLGCSFIFTLKVARYVKEMLPDVCIVLGGPHATILGSEILKTFSCFDLVVRYEAEPTVRDVLDRIPQEDFTGLPGVVWRKGKSIVENPGKPTVANLDELPWPAYDVYPIENLELRKLRIEAGRGCPFSCTFCSTAEFFGRSYRLKSADKLCDELNQLHAKYGITEFSLTHDLFTVNKKKVLEFCSTVKDSKYTWGCSARVDCVDPELISAMRAAGCTDVYYGIETGSKKMQEISRKRLDLDLLFPVLDHTVKSGISATVSFIVGYPQETEEDQNATFDLIAECMTRYGDGIITQLHMLTPEPGTHLNEQFRNDLNYDAYQTDFNSILIECDDFSIVQAHPEIFVTYYFYPSSSRRERTVLAVELLALLMQFGNSIVAHMLQFFDNKISVLVDAVEKRLDVGVIEMCQNGNVEKCILNAISEELGPEHYVTSLLRFCAETSRLRIAGAKFVKGERSSASEREVNQTSEALILASNVRLLANCHDPHHVLSHLAKEPTKKLPEENLKLGSFLVRVPKIGRGKVEIYQIDAFSFEVLKLFEKPRSVQNLQNILRKRLNKNQLRGFGESVRSLQRQGLVVPCPMGIQ